MRKGLDIVPSDPRFSRHISMIEKMIESDNNNDNNNVNHEEELQDMMVTLSELNRIPVEERTAEEISQLKQ